MFEYQTVYNGVTALIAGLVTSVHCVAMCGPLSCAFSPNRQTDAPVYVVLTGYHLGKLFGYTLIGALAGAFGSVVVNTVSDSWLNYLPWILVAFFLIVAFRLDRYFPKPVWLGKLYGSGTRRFHQMSKPLAATMIGLASPLLPCGPLYLIFGLCLFTGSAVRGAEFALGFGLGTMPLLWLAQSQFMRLQKRLKPDTLLKIQRIAALIAAVVIMWRLRDLLGIQTAIDFCF